MSWYNPWKLIQVIEAENVALREKLIDTETTNNEMERFNQAYGRRIEDFEKSYMYKWWKLFN